MYSRYPNYRFSGAMRVPENYSGNVFKPSESVDVSEESDTESTFDEVEAKGAEEASLPAMSTEAENLERETKPASKGFKLPAFNFDIRSLFSGKFGIEELLIIGLILLISKNDTDDDIILLLALLLFIG